MTRLNSTGSYQYFSGKYWSYDTKLTDTYKGYRVFNNTYYSATTRKHQSYCLREENFDFELNNCGYGNWNVEECIKREIDSLKYQLQKRQQQRKTAKQKEDVEFYTIRIRFFENLIKG